MSERLIDDYTKLTSPQLLKAMGIDANKWSDAFMQFKCKHEEGWIDHGLMIIWFANAMMAMHDHLQGNPILNGDHAEYLRNKANEL